MLLTQGRRVVHLLFSFHGLSREHGVLPVYDELVQLEAMIHAAGRECGGGDGLTLPLAGTIPNSTLMPE